MDCWLYIPKEKGAQGPFQNNCWPLAQPRAIASLFIMKFLRSPRLRANSRHTLSHEVPTRLGTVPLFVIPRRLKRLGQLGTIPMRVDCWRTLAPNSFPSVITHKRIQFYQHGWTLIRQVTASSDALTFALNLPRCPCVLTQHGWGLVSLYGPRCSRVRQSPCVLMPSSWIQTKQPSLVDLRVLTTPPMAWPMYQKEKGGARPPWEGFPLDQADPGDPKMPKGSLTPKL